MSGVGKLDSTEYFRRRDALSDELDNFTQSIAQLHILLDSFPNRQLETLLNEIGRMIKIYNNIVVDKHD